MYILYRYTYLCIYIYTCVYILRNYTPRLHRTYQRCSIWIQISYIYNIYIYNIYKSFVFVYCIHHFYIPRLHRENAPSPYTNIIYILFVFLYSYIYLHVACAYRDCTFSVVSECVAVCCRVFLPRLQRRHQSCAISTHKYYIFSSCMLIYMYFRYTSHRPTTTPPHTAAMRDLHTYILYILFM